MRQRYLLLLKIIGFLLLGSKLSFVRSFRVNITNFGNCNDEKRMEGNKHVVLVKSITYESVDGFCDTVHATYTIPTVNTADKKLEISMYRCTTGSRGQCNDNEEQFEEYFHCERFSKDKTGPWFMISDGMSGSKCGELAGEFALENARLKPEYLTNYMIQDVEHARHRMKILMLKKGKTEVENIVRACINVEFNIVF